jgi:hypothetical protein
MLDAQYFLDAGFSPEEAAALVAAFERLERAARPLRELWATQAVAWNPDRQCYQARRPAEPT